ncbi:MAG: TlpA family protein disulfide reductase [Deltaproteobacteria bacterium]|nr:TlpA family protein disulfide reductase [Deltaproteobacteria bacterium]
MKWRRHIRLLGIVVAVAAAQGLVLLVYRWVEHGRRDAKESTFQYERSPTKPAADLVLLHPDGSSRKLAELRGKPILLHFWATWCPPCKEELPGLLELGRELAREGELELIALTVDRDWAVVREFFGGEIPPEVMRDGAGSAALGYEVSNLPDTYLLGADGSIRLRFGGARNWRTKLASDTLRKELHGQRK